VTIDEQLRFIRTLLQQYTHPTTHTHLHECNLLVFVKLSILSALHFFLRQPLRAYKIRSDCEATSALSLNPTYARRDRGRYRMKIRSQMILTVT